MVVKDKNKMLSYNKKLTDAEVNDVVAYMRSRVKLVRGWLIALAWELASL